MNNQRSPVEEQTRNLVGVRVEFLTREETVENQARIRQSTWLNSQGLNGARIRRVGSAQPWQGRVVVRAICGTVGVVIPHEPAIFQHPIPCKRYRRKTYDIGG